MSSADISIIIIIVVVIVIIINGINNESPVSPMHYIHVSRVGMHGDICQHRQQIPITSNIHPIIYCGFNIILS